VKFTRTGSISLTVKSRWLEPSRDMTSDDIDGQRPSRAGGDSDSPNVAATTAARIPRSSRRLELHFSVTDTGIGISSSQLAGLFVTFGQVHHSSGEYGGSGLGLVISNRLVQAMGGDRITVQSASGAGSTFDFKLVMHPALERVPETVDMYGLNALQRRQLQHTRILFLSDDGVAATSWIHTLRQYGVQVDHARHIEQAAARMQERAQAAQPKKLGEELTYLELCALVSVVVVDLDKIDALEEQVINSLAVFSPLRLLFLRTKYTSSQPGKRVVSKSADAANGLLSPKSLILSTLPTDSIHFHHQPHDTDSGGAHAFGGAQMEVPVQPSGALSASSEHHLRGWLELTPEEKVLRRHHALSIKRILHKPFHCSVFLSLLAALSFESFRSIAEFESGKAQRGMSTSEVPSAIILAESPPDCVQLQQLLPLEHRSRSSGEDFAQPTPAAAQVAAAVNMAWPSSSVHANEHIMLPLASANAAAATNFTAAATSSQASGGVDHTKKVTSPGKNAIKKISHRCPLRVLLAEDNVVNQVSGRNPLSSKISLLRWRSDMLFSLFCSLFWRIEADGDADEEARLHAARR
jgi:hypothetical protein